jgi:hypothetical protein
LHRVLLDQLPRLVGEIGDKPHFVSIGVANRRIELRQALEGADVINEFFRRGQNFPEVFDVLVSLEKRFAGFWFKEPSIDKAFEALVGITAFAHIEVVDRRLRDLVEQVAHQDIEILDHSIYIRNWHHLSLSQN